MAIDILQNHVETLVCMALYLPRVDPKKTLHTPRPSVKLGRRWVRDDSHKKYQRGFENVRVEPEGTRKKISRLHLQQRVDGGTIVVLADFHVAIPCAMRNECSVKEKWSCY